MHRARRVRQGRLPRFRHRPDGAVVRAFHARGRTAHDGGSAGDGRHRRAARRHAPHLHSWPRESEPAGRSRGHGRTRRALQDLGVEDVHAMGAERPGLFHGRRTGHRADRKGAQARREEYRDPQGHSVWRAIVRTLDVRRHRARGEALSGCQFPDLSLGIRAGKPARVLTTRVARTASTRSSRACARTA